jgi:hypothetical protein
MPTPRRLSSLAFIALFALVALASFLRAQEPDVEQLLSRADEFYKNGNYSLAVGTYLEAAGMSKNPLNLSRAYFGLALCAFYQRDMAATTRWIRKVAEVDPNKQISVLFYPKPFVDMFNQVLKEARSKGRPSAAATPTAAEKAPVTAAAEEPKAKPKIEPKIEPKTAEPRVAEPPVSRPEPQPQKPAFPLGEERPGGHFEVSAHYASWSIDPIMSIFESSLTDKLAEELQNEVVKELGASYAGLVKAAFTPNLALDSKGSNYGLEVRFYARGWAGTFSFGLGLEQTHIRLALSGSVKQEFTNGGVAEATAEAFVETSPFSPQVSFRWEMGRPEARVKPYFVFGLGIAPFEGTFTYSYAGTYVLGTLTDAIEDSKTKTFKDVSEDIDFQIPDYIAILQLHFGLKVELFKGLFVLGEAGVWDGLILRGGMGYRF